jgi:hypothetical protein
MASVKYTYTKEADLGRLTQEIQTSSITIVLDYINSEGTILDIYFKAALSEAEETVLDAIIAAHVPTPLPEQATLVTLDNVKTSSMGNIIFEPGIFTGPSGSKGISLVTPDLSDRTTWYQKSVQVSDETLTDSGDGLTFTSAHPHWINIYSLKVTYTHKQIPKRDGTFGKHADWAITIKVDGSTVTTGFTINYPAGTVTFNSSKSGTITATYWHNDGVTHPSEWLLVPGTGKKLVVEHAELQFSSGMTINDTIRFEIWAGANLATYGSFPDYLFEAGYGQMRADYRNANDLINTANLGQGEIPKFGALTKNVTVIPFNYLQAFCLNSTQGAIFRVLLINDTPYTDCDICTGTFYTQIDNV